MEKKDNPFDDKSSNQLNDILKDIFGGSEPFLKLNREYKPIQLKKNNDMEYELSWQTSELEKDGHQIIHVAKNRFEEIIMIYRFMYNDGMDDTNIDLRIRIISKVGVKVPDLKVYVHVDDKQMEIADIRIEGEQVNRGYGSIMMEGLMKLVREMNIKVITGWISSVDWDHIDRSEYFYSKHGFECQLDHVNKRGTIVWVNRELQSPQF